MHMDSEYSEDETFEELNFSIVSPHKGTYERCIFKNCNFGNADLSEINFTECSFHTCDLSMATILKTAFRKAEFLDCKLLGLRFDLCDDFLLSFIFTNCDLSYASFNGLKIKKVNLKDCILHEVDFSNANLSEGICMNCDFERAVFEQTNLEMMDMSTSFNFVIDPEINKIKGAMFSIHHLSGLLKKYDIEIL